MDQLILKRASAIRITGEWGEDDYDVLADGVVVGRIVKAAASPVGKFWMWTVLFGTTRTAHRPPAMSRRARLRWSRAALGVAAARSKCSGKEGLPLAKKAVAAQCGRGDRFAVVTL
jgi:hypothetical protein